MSKMKKAKISKAYLPFLLFGHKECDRLWKLHNNYFYSQNHKTAKVRRNLWRLSGAQSYSMLPRPVTSLHPRIWPLVASYAPPYPWQLAGVYIEKLQGVTVWGPDKPWHSFHNVPQLSPWKATKLPKQLMRSENGNILLPAAGNCSLLFLTISSWCFCVDQI